MKEYYLVLSVREINELHARAHASMNGPNGRSDADKLNHCVILGGICPCEAPHDDQISSESFSKAVSFLPAPEEQAAGETNREHALRVIAGRQDEPNLNLGKPVGQLVSSQPLEVNRYEV